MNSIIISDENKEIVSAVKNLGYNTVFSENINELLPFERKHADLQCLKINDVFFVLKNCKTIIQNLKMLGKNVIETESDINGKYPYNVVLNAAYIGNKLFCKENSLDNTVKNYCIENNIEIINVNQGYTKCSTAIFSDYFITADKGIFKAMSENGVEGLLINSGEITLPGTDYGFIGGCSFYHNNTAYFTGDINKHTDGKRIISFLESKKIKTENLNNGKLYDIGGFIVL